MDTLLKFTYTRDSSNNYSYKPRISIAASRRYGVRVWFSKKKYFELFLPTPKKNYDILISLLPNG